MHVLIQQSVLFNSIQSVGRAVPQKPPHPVLSNIKIEADEDHLIFTGFDLSFGIEFRTSDCLIRQHGSACLPAKLLINIISKQDSNSNIEMIIDENNQCTLTCDSIEYQIAGMPTDEYPANLAESFYENQENVPDDYKEFVVNSNDLLLAAKNTVFAASQDDTKQILTGVNFEITLSRLTVAATDGHRLAVINVNPEQELELNIDEGEKLINLTIPAKILKELERMLIQTKAPSVSLIEGNDNLMFKIVTDTVAATLTCRSLNGQYPNYPQLIPDQDKFVTVLTIERKTLLKSIEKIATILDEKTQKLILFTFDYDNQQVKLSAETESVGKCFELLPCQLSGNDLEAVALRCNYLLDGLKTIDSNEIQIKFSGETNPCVVIPLSNIDMIYLIMPVKIRK